MNPKSFQAPHALLCDGRTLRDAETPDIRQRTYVMALITSLSVRVAVTGWRTLRLRLRDDYVWIQNTRQKRAIIERYQNHDDLIEYAARLARPNPRGWLYRGPVPWRWGSAGYIAIFNILGVRYLMLFLRKYPCPSGYNFPLGGAQSIAELERPHLTGEVEFKEETVLVDRQSNTLLLLDRQGGVHNPLTNQRAVLQALRLPFPRRRALILGRLFPNQPDIVHVGGYHEPRRTPYVSEPGIVLFDPADVGIEFLQAIEFDLDRPLKSLCFFDGEIHEHCELGDGLSAGRPIHQPVALFRLDRLVEAFSSRQPVPHPDVIFDRGWPLCTASEIRDWMEEESGAKEWCPAVLNGLRRFFETVYDIRNQFRQLPDGRWLVRYRGEEGRFPNWLAFAYLNYLLHQPCGTKVPSTQLYARFASTVAWGGSVYEGLSTTELAGENLYVEGSTRRANRFQGIDDRLRRLVDRLSKLKAERQDAENAHDSEEVAQLEDEIERATDELEELRQERAKLAESSAGGDEPGSPTRRMIWAVSQEIRRGIRLIKEQMPASGQHLDDAIHCGVTCDYSPSVEVGWM